MNAFLVEWSRVIFGAAVVIAVAQFAFLVYVTRKNVKEIRQIKRAVEEG